MMDLLILGTDTDVGKTTFSLLWLTAFPKDFEYWKPVETGPSDTEAIRRLVPGVQVHFPALRLEDPVAPPLAARRQGVVIPLASDLARSRPRPRHPSRALVIETFGSPFSSFNERELQIALLHRWMVPGTGPRMILISSSRLGAVGRTLASLDALAGQGLFPAGVVLLGPLDPYACDEIRKHRPGIPVFSLEQPVAWTQADLHQAVEQQRETLEAIRRQVQESPAGEEDLVEKDRKAVWHPYTPLQGELDPVPIMGAQDEFLFTADGRRLIDGVSSWWTILHGHRADFLMDALRKAAGEIDHVLFAGATHPWGVELAERLLNTMPWSGGRVFFSDNGSTAVEVALKLAYQFWCLRGQPGRKRFVGFQHGYHGDTFGAMAVSRDRIFFNRFEPLLFHADILPLDPNFLEDFLKLHAKEIAGVILEPLVQGAGGMRMHTPETLRSIVEIVHRHGCLFIADEVMTGGGRTGTLWAFQAAGIAPDLVCAAKTLAGGLLPLACTLAAPGIVAEFDQSDRSKTFFHGHSFTAHPLACAVAAANWRRLTAQPLTDPARLEQFWKNAFASWKGRPRVKEVRIQGSIAAVELDLPGGYLAEQGRAMRAIAQREGVFLRPLGSVLYALPPFCTSDASLTTIVDAMDACRNETIERTGNQATDAARSP